MQQQGEAEEEEGQVVRVLCPVDRIGDVSRLSVPGARIRFDCASASPFPSDRVLLISSSIQQQHDDAHALQAALLGVFDRIFAHNYHHHVSRLLLSPSSPILSMANTNTLPHPAGAILRIFPKDHAFPAFTGPPHHLLTITGSFPSVKNALLTLSPFLLHAPPPPTTTHVLIPSPYLPFITASHGTHISHIQQMSGASLTLQDPKPGQTTGTVIIFGTTHQTKTAQSLLHGLIFCGVFDPS